MFRGMASARFRSPLLVASIVLALAAPASAQKVLVIPDEDAANTATLVNGLNAAGQALTGGLQMPHRRRGDLATDVARVGTYFEASRQR